MKDKVLLIGFSGAAGSGKTTAADMITDIIDKKINCLAEPNKPNLVINVQKFAFGSALKQILIDIFGFTNAQLNTPEGKTEFNKKWGMTNREALQKFGTDAIRQHFHKDAWVFAAECTLNQMITDRSNLSIPLVILCHDVRFVNEKEAQGFILLPNQKALLMDTANKKFWIKYTDSLGNSSTETYRFEKIENGDSNVTLVEEKPAIDTSLFAKKEDLSAMATKDDLKAMNEQIAKLQKQIRLSILDEKPLPSVKVE